jgi:hypothetical protein
MRVNRRLGAVAWIAATVLSVAASTAAVAAVREQVTDGPALVSLAALRRAAEAESASPRLDASPEETSRASIPSPTTSTTEAPATTRPDVEAVPDTIVETTTTTTTVENSASPTTTVDDGDRDRGWGGRDDDGTDENSRDFRGGSVTFRYDGEQLQLVEATTKDDYDYEIERQSDRELVLRFSNGDRRSTLVVATVVNGRVQIRVVG